jgi:hypothetical protein
MKFGPRSFALCACLCISGVMAAAQGTTCAADGEAPAQGSPIACVTGEGVQVTAASTAAPAAEILPLAPEQRPAAPPVVTYVDGKLTVVAKNSTLGDILRAVAAKTGASIDVPEAANERVVSQLGPAPARDVMAALLNGSHYNYVMVGTETNPNSVAHVILTAKTDRPEGSTGAPPTASMARQMVQPRTALQAAIMQPYQEMLQQQQAQQAAATELQQQMAETVPETPAQVISEASASNSAASTASSDSAPAEAPPAGEAPRTASGASEKTPTQVLQDLYETRRQMIQQQHQPPPPQPPPQQ